MTGFKRKRTTMSSKDNNEEMENLIFGADNRLKIEVFNNKIYFYEDITTQSVLTLSKHLLTLENNLLKVQQELTLEETPKIFIYIQSNGGDAYAGLSIMNTLENMRVPVVTIVNGIVASAATLMLLGGCERHMQRNSNILIHQIRGGIWGKYDDLQDEMKNSAQLMKDLEQIYTTKTNIPLSFLRRIIKRELNMNPDQCLEYNIIDKII